MWMIVAMEQAKNFIHVKTNSSYRKKAEEAKFSRPDIVEQLARQSGLAVRPCATIRLSWKICRMLQEFSRQRRRR
jgi:hypothetical protein